MMDKLKMQSVDNVQMNIEKIQKLFPNAVTEVKRNGKVTLAVDFDVLKQELSSELIDDKEERYQMTWPDKKESIILANTPVNKTLRPCREESVDFDNTQNLYIEGDNLDVLKLLQETYLGKIKMIYIDPPYNTGNDFVYNDDFAMDTAEYADKSGQYDEQGDRLVQNFESNGRFHTDWLNMIYPRLKVAKDLLSDDGVIFISIDDNEQANLKKICDEIFDTQNHVGTLIRKVMEGGKSDSTGLVVEQEYCHIYGKNAPNGIYKKQSKHLDHYNKQDKYFSERGYYYLKPLENGGLGYVPTLDYPIIGPDGADIYPGDYHGDNGYRWVWSKEKVERALKMDMIVFIPSQKDKTKYKVYYKTYEKVDTDGNQSVKQLPYSTLYLDGYTNRQAVNDLKRLFEKTRVFDYPKPISFLQEIIAMASKDDCIVMDFFSGSGSFAQDSFASRRPIDVIAANRPIIILDEPQKLGGSATQESIKLFKPLFSLNYSATHKEVHNLVYVLDALDAYKKKLVKKIEVKGFELRNLRGTDRFFYLSQILLDPKKPPMARLTFDIKYANGIKRESRIVAVNDNIYEMSSGKNMPPLEQYKGYVVKEINPLNNTLTFLNGETLHVGEVYGDKISERDMRRIQIRETILSHFEKEEKLFNRGIKCLSLFFIDEVSHYRQYDEDGNEVLGDFGKMFEEEYTDALNQYTNLFYSPYVKYLNGIDVHDTHKGYFSIDKKTNRVVNSVEKRGVCDDISAYDLILKNKERLLSFDEPTRFIFSHSALREGWDNPNVFQICTLKQSNSEVNKRQEVGRGMRLCVNRNGERMDSSVSDIKVHDINVLTVIASDSYKNFVGELQKEIKDTLYDRPTKATKEYFAGKSIKLDDGKIHEVTKEESGYIERYLGMNGYIDYEGNVTDKYRDDVENGTVAPLPSMLSGMENGIQKLVQSVYDEKAFENIIEDAGKPKIIENNLNDNFAKKEFQTLWNYINHKYAYTVSFDSDELIKNAIKAIDDKMYVTEVSYIRTLGEQADDSFEFADGKTKTAILKNSGGSNVKYDLIGKICQGTYLTRKTIVKILKGVRPDIFAMFKKNPEEFISKAITFITEQKATMVVEEISYNVTEEEPYSSDIFTAEKGLIDLSRAIKAEKHITPYVVTDSDTEKNFATDLEHDDGNVCVYAKLPKAFKIPTPVGDYTPDWAIAFYEGKVKYIYFIAETKGNMSSMQLKKVEEAKTNCAKKLFNNLSNGAVRYDVVDTYQHLLDIMSK